MNVKTGTQAWSKTPQPGIRHADSTHYNSAVDEAKVANPGEDVGAILNKVADPNYVDSSKKMRTVGNAELGKDAFMNLLLTQMKSQDPTNPLKSHEMAAQLAQFTSLEKLTNIEAGITGLRTESKPDKNFEALALIGKSVTTDSTKIGRTDQKATHDLKFRLMADAQKADISIKDAKGNVVRKLTFNNLKTGKNNLTWNGQYEDGTQAPIGDYTMEIDARGSNGNKIFAQMKAQGVITGINFTSHGPQVLIGKEAIDLTEIKSISEANPQEQEMPAGIPMPGLAGHQLSLPPQLAGMMGPAAAPASAAAAASVSDAISGMPAMMAPSHSAIPSAENAMPVQPVAHHEKPMVHPETKADGAKRSRMAQGSVTDAQMPGSLFKQLIKQGVGEG
jgi:flagellar basal-body rod modification protein FlgD